jgi:hypothetical protein
MKHETTIETDVRWLLMKAVFEGHITDTYDNLLDLVSEPFPRNGHGLL